MSPRKIARHGDRATSSGLSRRHVLILGAGAAAASPNILTTIVQAADIEHHGLSAFGDLAYPRNFSHLKYVNPTAPKGGTFGQLAGGGTATFNSLNGFILKGDPAFDMELVFASLMARANDEPDAVYAMAAEYVTISGDGRTYRFKLRDGITFHDGSPITAADVAFSLSILKEKGHPNIGILLRDLEAASTEGDRIVSLQFEPTHTRNVPLLAATLPIFSRTFYAKRKFEETTLEPPLGSGPYRVGRFEQGRFLEFERVKNWWGAHLPIMRGQHNFDVVRYDYYRDREAAFEGFSAKNYTFREEFTSRVWATRYDLPAIRDGRIKRETIPDDRPSGAQGWMINTRREKFRDSRLREAFAYAFDFEWANKNLMFGSYARTHSYFQNSDMMAKGKPSTEELTLLEPLRDKLSKEVFGEIWIPPVSDGSGQDRRLLRRAAELLNQAGWTIKDGKRVNAKGEPLTVEFLVFERVSEPHHALYIKNLVALGVEATVRLVEPVQYRARMQDFDFDITMQRLVFSLTPGDTLRNIFSSKSASSKGSFNYSGVSDPAVNFLVEQVIKAKSRSSMYVACRALDRVLRAGHYWVPGWYKPSHWIAYWDIFGRPETKPRYARGIPETWWYDADRAAKSERSG
jgi:microcin C transport system substrate-binding protein